MKRLLANIDVVILCGGKGSRLRSVVSDRPKPMAEINGHVFLDLLIEYLASFGFKRFILCAGYMGQMIEDYYKDDARVSVVIEQDLLGTGGALKNIENKIETETVLVLNGDTYCQLDYADICAQHLKTDAALTIVLSVKHDIEDAGVVDLSEDNRLVRYREKVFCDKGHISAGIYIMKKEYLKNIPSAEVSSLEKDIFPVNLGNAFAYVTDKEFYDIGTPERLIRMQQEIR